MEELNKVRGPNARNGKLHYFVTSPSGTVRAVEKPLFEYKEGSPPDPDNARECQEASERMGAARKKYFDELLEGLKKMNLDGAPAKPVAKAKK